MNKFPSNTTQLQLLLDQAAAGNQEAYGELVSHASERLLRLTRKMLEDFRRLKRWEDTDDVFQTAVMRLYQSLFQVQPASVREFFGLAATQIRRTLIDLARHYYGPEGLGRRHLSEADPAWGETRIEQHPDPTDQSDQPEMLEPWVRFHQSIEQLPRPEREVFHLVWYAGLPQAEVAELLGVSLSTVQRRWYQAQQQLAAALCGDTPVGGDE